MVPTKTNRQSITLRTACNYRRTTDTRTCVLGRVYWVHTFHLLRSRARGAAAERNGGGTTSSFSLSGTTLRSPSSPAPIVYGTPLSASAHDSATAENSDSQCRCPSSPLVLVTAVSDNHYHAVQQLLMSIRWYEPNQRVLVYDIGLIPAQRADLNSRACIDVRVFDFSAYPPHVGIENESGLWAWKPLIIERHFSEPQTETVLWMDAGDRLHNTLQELKRVANHYGIFSTDSGGRVADWTHPGLFTYCHLLQSRF